VNTSANDGETRRSHTPTGISEVLNNFFAPPERQKKLRAYRLWQFWHDVVGPQIATHAHPLRIRDAILEVRVDQPVWMQQLQLLKPQILKRLNDRLGEQLIDDLFFRRGQVTPPVSPPPPKPPLAQLTATEREHVTDTVAALADDDLREELGKLLELQMRLAKSRKTSD